MSSITGQAGRFVHSQAHNYPGQDWTRPGIQAQAGRQINPQNSWKAVPLPVPITCTHRGPHRRPSSMPCPVTVVYK